MLCKSARDLWPTAGNATGPCTPPIWKIIRTSSNSDWHELVSQRLSSASEPQPGDRICCLRGAPWRTLRVWEWTFQRLFFPLPLLRARSCATYAFVVGCGVAMFFPLGQPTTWRVMAMEAGEAPSMLRPTHKCKSTLSPKDVNELFRAMILPTLAATLE